MTFNDATPDNDVFPPKFRDLPGFSPINSVMLEPRFWSDPRYGADWDSTGRGRNPRLCVPNGGEKWRDLVVEVTPQGLRGYWEGKQPVGRPSTPSDVIESADDEVVKQRLARPADPSVAAVGPHYVPRGGIGLYVQRATGSFRNVIVEPLTAARP